MNCKNCNKELDATDDFCNACGAKIIRNRLTMRNLFAHFGEQFLNYDNRFFQTFISLFSKPDVVIDGYINGVRKKYVNVVSYFAIALTVSGLQLLILDKFFPNAMDMSAMATTQGSEQINNDVMNVVREYQSIFMMLNVPMYAIVSYFVFYTLKKYNYTEHLVIFMYVLSQMTFLGALISISCAFFGFSLGHASLILLPIQIIYSAYVLYKLYKLSLSGLLLRTLLFFGILFAAFILIIIIVALVVIFFKDSEAIQSILEAQKAAQEGNS